MDKVTKLKVHEPATYRIYVQGELDKSWSDYFGDMVFHIEVDPDEFPLTTMTGQFHDQSALLGVISQLVDLGFMQTSKNFLNWRSRQPESPRNQGVPFG